MRASDVLFAVLVLTVLVGCGEPLPQRTAPGLAPPMPEPSGPQSPTSQQPQAGAPEGAATQPPVVEQEWKPKEYTAENPVAVPMEYVEVVVNQPRQVQLTMHLNQWRQAINAFNTFNGRYPKDLDEVRNDANASPFIPERRGIPDDFQVRYDPARDRVYFVRLVPKGSGQPK